MRLVPLVVCAALAASGCHKKPATETSETKTVTAATAPETTSPAAATSAAPAPAAAAAGPAPAPVGTFDTGKASVSAVKLGAFPYLSLPDGYKAASPETLDLTRFPVWVGDHFVWVAGKVYQTRIEPVQGKSYSKYEVQQNIESLIAQAGGKKIAEVQLPSDMRSKLDPDARQVDTGLGDIISNPVVTFLIHQADKDIWVHFTSGTQSGSLAVIETKAFVPTAKLLPASTLRRSIDTTGTAVIAVNFAVDRATILPSSAPEIGEVVKITADPVLKLAVAGHTDNSGTAAHNLALSAARAKSVVAALVSAGVEPARLTAHVYDADRPVASNDTEDGRAKNRRVDLVRA